MSKPNVEDLYPLTPLQEGMLFHTVYSPGSGAYREQITTRVRGAMRPEVYAEAWQRAVDRHPALRSSFIWEKVPRPLQAVHRGVRLPVQTHDWRHLPPAERDRRFGEVARLEHEALVDLNHPPLIRLAVARMTDDESGVVLTFHHILLDGWSLALVMNEVAATYDALVAGRRPVLPAPRPYREYLAWLARQDGSAAEAYWRGALAGLEGPTRLGIERPAPPEPPRHEDYGREAVTLSPEETEALRAAGRRHKLTPNTLLQGAWAILLSRYAATDDVVFGATVSGRPADLPGVEAMVGLFINTVPVRARVDADAPLLGWLHALQDAQAESRQHGHAPLVDVHGWSGVPRDRPLMESLLVFENYPSSEGGGGEEPSLLVIGGESPERTTYPLTVVVSPDGPALQLRATFDARILPPADVRRVLGHLSGLLSAILEGIERPDVLLRDLSMATDEDRALAASWSGEATPYPRERSLAGLFAEQVRLTPGAVAVEAEDGSLTYAELDARAGALARRLRELGVGPESRVGLALERSAALVVAEVAAVKLGAAYVPLDPAYPTERLAFMLADSGIRVLVTTEALRGSVQAEIPVVSVDGDDDSVASTDASSEPLVDAFAAPESLACVLYTSGSTGRPKGIGIPHRAVVRLVKETDHVRFAGQRVALIASVSFDVSIWEVWGSLLNGATIVAFPRHAALAPATFAAALRERRVSTIFLTTSLFNQLAREIPGAFAGVENVLAGGEALDPDAMRRVLEGGPPARLLNAYGPTESCTYATWHLIREVPAGAANVPIGRPLANTRAHVLDEEMRPAAVGVPGELCLGGDGLARGYVGRPAMTAERFIPDPFSDGGRLYRTGDLARWTGDGVLEFVRRMDDQVKLRGFRVEPGEVEAALRALPGVRDAVVAVRPDARGDRRLVAWVVPASAAAGVDGMELRAALRRTLPDWMLPSAFVPIARVPITPNGKLDRRALPAPDDAEAQAPYVAPRDDREAAIVKVFETILGLERVGVHDDFFAIGGHSLRATQVVSRIRDALNVDVTLPDLFTAPTPALLAERLQAREDEMMAALLEGLEGLSEDEVRAQLAAAEDGAPGAG
jgi:amino acid adenylation domain-containing protein